MRENTITGWRDGQCARAVWSGSPAAISAGSAAGPEAGERRPLTVCELGREYARTAEVLKERIQQVEALREREEDDRQLRQLDYRLRLLRSMWRDARALAAHLEHYYERGVSRNENYVIR